MGHPWVTVPQGCPCPGARSLQAAVPQGCPYPGVRHPRAMAPQGCPRRGVGQSLRGVSVVVWVALGSRSLRRTSSCREKLLPSIHLQPRPRSVTFHMPLPMSLGFLLLCLLPLVAPACSETHMSQGVGTPGCSVSAGPFLGHQSHLGQHTAPSFCQNLPVCTRYRWIFCSVMSKKICEPYCLV